jgi:UDP-N-acetylglucosamine:LPS N-acetylglucosamine transferase
MKKILYISECMGGGVRKHIIDLLKNIDKQRYKIYFMYSSIRADDVFKEEIKRLSKNIELIENNYMIREVSLKNDLKAFNQIKKLIKKIKPDIVHCHSSKAGALGRLAAKIMGVKKYIILRMLILCRIKILVIRKNLYLVQ